MNIGVHQLAWIILCQEAKSLSTRKRVQKLTTPLESNFGAGCMKEIGGTIRDEIVIWYTTGNGIFSFFEGKETESLQDHSNYYSAKAQKTAFQASDF